MYCPSCSICYVVCACFQRVQQLQNDYRYRRKLLIVVCARFPTSAVIAERLYRYKRLVIKRSFETGVSVYNGLLHPIKRFRIIIKYQLLFCCRKTFGVLINQVKPVFVRPADQHYRPIAAIHHSLSSKMFENNIETIE